MSKLDNRNKDLLELCRKQEKEIKELILKLAKMKEDNKTSAPSCEQLEGVERLTEKRIVQPSCTITGEIENKEYIYIKDKTLAVKKLFELEDIEEYLHIDLIIGGKALINGIFTKHYGFISGNNLQLEKARIYIPMYSVALPFYGPVGYGKT